MGLFGNKNKASKQSISWEKLTSKKELEEAIELSCKTPVMLFKHSTRCSISSMALSRIESEWNYTQEQIVPFYLDLIAYREVSNQIAESLNVFHASPQMIIVKNGKAVLDASHNQIRASLVGEVI